MLRGQPRLTNWRSTPSRPGEPSPRPCTMRTQRLSACIDSARKRETSSCASCRLSPCRSVWFWIVHRPRRRSRSTLRGSPTRRKELASLMASRSSLRTGRAVSRRRRPLLIDFQRTGRGVGFGRREPPAPVFSAAWPGLPHERRQSPPGWVVALAHRNGLLNVIKQLSRFYPSRLSRYFSASSAAMQLVPAEVQAWR